MRNYEVTFIVDPVLSGDEIKATAQTYVDALVAEGCNIVQVDEMGLKQLAYPINRRTTGIYYCIEFEVPDGQMITRLELALRRDERIMRFLTVKLDKYGVKYNEDKRNGLIGKFVKKEKKSDRDRHRKDNRREKRTSKPASNQGGTTATESRPKDSSVKEASAATSTVVASKDDKSGEEE